MDLIEKYYNKVKDLIKEAANDGIEIATYYSQIDNENDSVVDTGIVVGINVVGGGEYKTISTWH